MSPFASACGGGGNNMRKSLRNLVQAKHARWQASLYDTACLCPQCIAHTCIMVISLRVPIIVDPNLVMIYIYIYTHHIYMYIPI